MGFTFSFVHIYLYSEFCGFDLLGLEQKKKLPYKNNKIKCTNSERNNTFAFSVDDFVC